MGAYTGILFWQFLNTGLIVGLLYFILFFIPKTIKKKQAQLDRIETLLEKIYESNK